MTLKNQFFFVNNVKRKKAKFRNSECYFFFFFFRPCWSALAGNSLQGESKNCKKWSRNMLTFRWRRGMPTRAERWPQYRRECNRKWDFYQRAIFAQLLGSLPSKNLEVHFSKWSNRESVLSRLPLLRTKEPFNYVPYHICRTKSRDDVTRKIQIRSKNNCLDSTDFSVVSAASTMMKNLISTRLPKVLQKICSRIIENDQIFHQLRKIVVTFLIFEFSTFSCVFVIFFISSEFWKLDRAKNF